MKKNTFLQFILLMGTMALVVLAVGQASAQRECSEREITRDTITRWIYHNSALKRKILKPVKVSDGRIYSVWQQTVIDSLQRWVQSSYYPRAAAHHVRNSVVPGSQYEILQNSPVHVYGISYHLFPAAYSNRLKKLDVGGEASNVLSIYANGPIGEYVEILSGRGRFWFMATPPLNVTSPSTNNDDDGFLEEFKTYPGIAPYLHWHRQHRGAHTIVLAKNNKLPFTKVTVNEYLQAFAEYTKSRATTDDSNYKLPAEFVAQELKRISGVRGRLESRLSEAVQFSVEDGYYDPANICNGTNCNNEPFEIYELSPAVMEATQKDKPLWINITMRWLPDDLRSHHLYQSVCNNFNFDFVHNYFFSPEKVKNLIYQPVNAPLKTIPIKSYVSDRSVLVSGAKHDLNILFFEDFSGNAVGKEPVGWFSVESNTSKLSAKYSSVQQPNKNSKDLWLKLAPRQVVVNNGMNKPLPQNFTVSFEITCSENYSSSAVSFFLSDIKDNDQMLGADFGRENLGKKANSTLLLKIRPASNEGVQFSFSSPKGDPKYSSLSKNYRSISSFTGKRDSEIARVELSVSGSSLKIVINKELVIDENNIIPPGVTFSTLSWAALSNVMQDGDEIYLGNVKIEKNR